MLPSIESTLFAAAVAGLATSLHCVVMCGPLACALRVRPVEYHASRLGAYIVAGAVAGALGQTVTMFFRGDATRFVPWVFALILIVLGLGLEKRLPVPRFATSLLLRARLQHSLGWVTPLFPCVPLWLMIGTAALTGTWWSGALHMAFFAAGTMPLPFIFQWQAARLQHRLSPRLARWTQQSLALCSAGILIWRALIPVYAAHCH